MSFLSGWALWLLSLGAVITVIYFLKRQAQPVPVSTLFLWQGAERRPKSALRLRWTQLLALFLQLLALILLVVGLARPVVYTSAGGVRTLAVMLDGSASMRARLPQGPTRYERALEEALKLIEANPAAEVAVISAQAHSSLLVPLTRDHTQLRRALRRSEPTYQGDAEISDLISLLQSQSPQGFDRVVYFTDHLADLDVGALGWEINIIGREGGSENLAITRFSVRAQPDGSGYDLFLEIWNSHDQAFELPLEIRADGKLIEKRQVKLAARASTPFSFGYSGPPASRFTADLVTQDLRDDWSEDNVRYASLPQPRPWKVLLVGEPNFYLERFLKLSGWADLTLQAGWDEGLITDEYDLIILSDAQPLAPMAGRFLLINTPFPPWIELGEEIDARGLSVEVTADHPLIADIDPAEWRLLRARKTEVAPGGKVILTVGEVPLLYLYETAGLRLAYLGVELDASNLGLSIDFPILMYRLLFWLAPRAEEETQVEIGAELPLGRFEGPLRVTGPDGRSCQYLSEDVRCGLVDRPGFYEISRNGTSEIYVANPPSQESYLDFSGASYPDRSEGRSIGVTPSSAEELRAARSLWPYLLGAGILLLILELLYFDRSLFMLRPLRRLG